VSRPLIGILGHPADPHVAAVATEARGLGGDAVAILGDLRTLHQWRWTDDGPVLPDGKTLGDFNGFYVRSLPLPLPQPNDADGTEPGSAWADSWDSARRSHALAKAVHGIISVSGVNVLNPLDGYWLHRAKPSADLRFVEAGLRVPAGLVTTDADEALAFLMRHGQAVYKPVAGGASCHLLTPDDFTPHRRAEMARAPVYFQQRVEGDDLRVYVLDDEIICAVHIRTNAIDYRGNEEGVDIIDAGDDIANVARRAAAALGLAFSGVDIKRGPEGALTVLDANPSPMFLGVERRTGTDIARAVASHLMFGEQCGTLQ
jgi:hypothetical protein